MLRDADFHAELDLDGGIRVAARANDGVVLALHRGVLILAADTALGEARLADLQVIEIDERAPRSPREGRAAGEAGEIERFRRFLDNASPGSGHQ